MRLIWEMTSQILESSEESKPVNRKISKDPRLFILCRKFYPTLSNFKKIRRFLEIVSNCSYCGKNEDFSKTSTKISDKKYKLIKINYFLLSGFLWDSGKFQCRSSVAPPASLRLILGGYTPLNVRGGSEMKWSTIFHENDPKKQNYIVVYGVF